MKFVSAAIAMLVSSVSAWDYFKHGDDWVDSHAACGTGPQSPIAVPFSLPSRDQIYFATDDQYNKIFSNIKGNIKIHYSDLGTKVWINYQGSDFQYIHMNLPFEEWGASPIWKGELFKLHSPSQHKIGDTRYDMEISIQTKRNLAIGDIEYALTSILFSVDGSTAIFCTKDCIEAIDNFFDDLKLNQTGSPDVTTGEVRFGDAFMYFDTDNRFNYKGSNTFPPCQNGWMIDVCMTIYPIKQRHVDDFRNFQLSRNPSTKDYNPATGAGGNYRKLQPVTDAHSIFLVTNEYSAASLLLAVSTAIFVVLCMIFTVACCCYCCKHKKLQRSVDGKEATSRVGITNPFGGKKSNQ